jgi:hypothetical protein
MSERKAYPEKDLDKQDVGEIKNYTRVPNMLIFGYQEINPQEKWLYVCLKHLCGKAGTRHLSLRYISDQTGISVGALSGSKDPEKKNPGMMRRLHLFGLIHAEIKKKKQNGKEKDQPQYHVTITDVWLANQAFFQERSGNEHLEEEISGSVQNMNATVQNMNTLTGERSEYEQERSGNDTILILDSKTTVNSKITIQDESISADADSTRAFSSSQELPIATSAPQPTVTQTTQGDYHDADSSPSRSDSDGFIHHSSYPGSDRLSSRTTETTQVKRPLDASYGEMQPAPTTPPMVSPPNVDKSQEIEDKSTEKPKGGSRKPAKPKDETLPKRIEAVLDCLDELEQERISEPSFKWSRTQVAKSAIKTLLTSWEGLSREQVKAVYRYMVESPPSEDGWAWSEHMSVKSFCNNFSSEFAKMKTKAKNGNTRNGNHRDVLNGAVNAQSIAEQLERGRMPTPEQLRKERY